MEGRHAVVKGVYPMEEIKPKGRPGVKVGLYIGNYIGGDVYGCKKIEGDSNDVYQHIVERHF